MATNGATMAAPVRAPGTAVAAITVRRLDVLIGSLIGFLWLVWLVLTSRDPKGALFALLEGSSGSDGLRLHRCKTRADRTTHRFYLIAVPRL